MDNILLQSSSYLHSICVCYMLDPHYLLTSSLCCHLHIVGCQKTVCSITRACTVGRCISAKPQPQILGQLPIECTTPGPVFEKVGIHYAGPFYIKINMDLFVSQLLSLLMHVFCLIVSKSSSCSVGVWPHFWGLYHLFETFCCLPW